ncbi:MAG: 4'-phosphopantetheinyl transferase superfamily protein [Bacteroidota bacterium]
MPYNLSKGSLLFKREKSSYNIGFGSIRGSLAALSDEKRDLLHKLENQKLADFKFDKRKHSYLLGRLSAKIAISTINKQLSYDLLISEGIFSFPVIKNLTGNHLQLSISHCDDIGMTLAYPEEHPVGIDIERVNEKSKDALYSIVNEQEKMLLGELPVSEIEGLGIAWTVKEALSKILRTGMMMDFSNFEISKITQNGHIFTSEYKHASQYKAISFFNAPYMISLAVPGRSELDTDQLTALIINILESEPQ